MTLAMPDSINVDNLPPGYDAYLGYTDGKWPTAKALAATFPTAELVLLTVTAGMPAAHGVRVAPGVDVEPGDVTAATAAAWTASALMANPLFRPVIYASIGGDAYYGMPDILAELPRFSISRTQVRLLSAHYGQGAHICGPASCGESSVEMDGTQWTNEFITPWGKTVDMSMLADDFFTGSTGLNRTERLVQELGTVQRAATGTAVETVQGLINARGLHVMIDGRFGLITEGAVKTLQAAAHIPIDGIVGPQTWPVLLGVA